MGTCQCEKRNSSNEGELNDFFTRNHEPLNNNNDNTNYSDIKINMVKSKINEEQNQEEEEEIIENDIKSQK